MTKHSKIGASSMYRWSACPGSVRLCEGIESKSSVHAAEGNVAHDVAEDLLLGCPSPVVGEVAKEAGHDIAITAEMLEAVSIYVAFVRGLVGPGDVLHIERSFDLSAIHPGCFGTADCVIWKPKEKRLIVVDYKHGAGIPVEAAGNPQLRYYGLGALLETKYPAETVELVIVQPRCEYAGGAIRSEVIDAIDLLDFAADLKDYALATEKPDAPLVPGDHCRFCPAAPTCSALRDKAQEVAKLEFSFDLSYDPQKLKLALDSREVIKAWLKALDEFAYAEAEAGRMPPGYKLVAKRPTRKWRSEGEVVQRLQEVGIQQAVMFETPALKSPAQLEKVVDKKLLADMIISESSGHTLVPESDKRPPVKVGAKEEFGVVDT